MNNQNQEKDYLVFSENLKRQIEDDIKNNFSIEEINKLNKKTYKSIAIISNIIAVVLILLSGGLLLFLLVFNIISILNFGIFWGVCLIISSVIFAFGFYSIRFAKKFIDFFANLKNLGKYYRYYSELFYPEISIKEVNYQINQHQNYEKIFADRVYTNPQLHGLYQDYEFSIGTQTFVEEHVTKTKDSTNVSYSYTEILNVTVKIDNINFKTLIKPETKLTIMFKTKKTKNQALESQEFEKKFKLDYQDPIKLRKLLSPKVMVNLLDLSEKQKIPKIYFNNEYLTIKKVVNKSSSDFLRQPKLTYLANIRKKSFLTQNEIKNLIETTIIEDFDKISKILLWADAFKLHSKYELKILKY